MIKSDGNGGFVIPKWFFAIVSLILVIISALGGVVAAGATVKSDIEYLKEGYAVIDVIETRLIELEKNTVGSNVELKVIKEDIKEIKSDIKQLLNQGGDKKW